MPHDKGLPQTGDSQDIAQDALNCLYANRPNGWRLTQIGGENDFGFDLQAQIWSRTCPVGSKSLLHLMAEGHTGNAIQ